jgi:hypothetical protein
MLQNDLLLMSAKKLVPDRKFDKLAILAEDVEHRFGWSLDSYAAYIRATSAERSSIIAS